MQRRIFKQTQAARERLDNEARQLRHQAETATSRISRDHLLRKARQAHTAADIDDWLDSLELQSPR